MRVHLRASETFLDVYLCTRSGAVLVLDSATTNVGEATCVDCLWQLAAQRFAEVNIVMGRIKQLGDEVRNGH